MGKDGSVKGLVLASVFQYCYWHERKLTVSELLANAQLLRTHYGHRPQVLSNILRRYYKLGLLCREEDVVVGHPYRYNLTEKRFNRLFWMFMNRARYLYSGIDVFEQLRPLFRDILQKKRYDMISKQLWRLREQISASQRKSRTRIIET